MYLNNSDLNIPVRYGIIKNITSNNDTKAVTAPYKESFFAGIFAF